MSAAILCFASTAYCEVRLIDENTVAMHVDEYRFFITRIRALEAETASLKRVLADERESVGELIKLLNDADDARLDERLASDARIRELEEQVRTYERKKWAPGIVAGGGATGDGRMNGFLGLGWKIDVW